MSIRVLVATLAAVVISGAVMAADPIVIAHRGASGYLPEHTLEAYAMAYALGADYIEPDLVRTKDGAYIALHDIHLQSTTNVEEVFPDRTRKDGQWYAADFTLAEIKTLQVHERVAKRFPTGKSDFEVPTFQEMIELIQGLNASTGRDVGIYPELKSPSFHNKQDLPMEAEFLKILEAYGYKGPEAKVFIQCFEPPTTKKLRTEYKTDLPIIQLVSGGQSSLLRDDALKEIATYANGIGPDKRLVIKNPEIVKTAQAHGLAVHPYTIRRDATPSKFKTTEEELRAFFFEYGVDGMFTDFTDDAVRVVREGR